MTKLFYVLIVTIVFSVAAFAQTNLGNSRWELTHLNGKIVADSKAYIEFDENEKRITGNTGCNRMFGSYELDGRKFNVNGVGSTKMACLQPGKMKTESAFLNAIGGANRVRIVRGTLRFYVNDTVVAKFKRNAVGDSGGNAAISSMKWMLTSIGETSVHLTNDAPFLNFDSAKRSAGGNSGCNVFGGNYAVDGLNIKFSDIISTMRACEFDDRMSIERGFMDALQKADRFRINKTMLFIYKGDELLLSFVNAPK